MRGRCSLGSSREMFALGIAGTTCLESVRVLETLEDVALRAES